MFKNPGPAISIFQYLDVKMLIRFLAQSLVDFAKLLLKTRAAFELASPNFCRFSSVFSAVSIDFISCSEMLNVFIRKVLSASLNFFDNIHLKTF